MDWTRDRIVAAVILIASFAIFRLSQMHPIADSKFQMMFSQHLLRDHSFSLQAPAFASFQSNRPIEQYVRGVDYPYQLERWGDRFYYWFPPGSTILSMPYVALANARGIAAMDKNGIYDPRAETRIQAGLAALLMAGLTAIMYFTARLFLPISWSSLIAAAMALGTTIWSIASRSMWIHTWGIFVLGLVVWLVARAELRRSLHPVLLATCLSWLYFIRPSFALSIIGVSVYVFIRYRRAFVTLVLTGAAWLAAFLGYSYYHFGHLLPHYYQTQPYMMNFGASFWDGLSGTLVSPSRGLFIYSPMLLFVGYLLVRYRKQLRPGLTWLALGIVCVHLVFMSAYANWHGGHCYGPRYCTDVIPWFALLSILAVEARLRWTAANPTANSVRRVRVEWSFALLLLGFSMVLNGIGGTSVNAWYWNALPSDVDHNLARLWDWKHPPFVQILKPRPDR